MQRKQAEKDKPKQKSIKVSEETHKQLEEMGIGISKAVEILAEEGTEAVEKKIEEISQLGEELGTIMLERGLFDIRFAGASITDVKEDGEIVDINARIKIAISDDKARKAVIEALKPKKEEKQDEQ